MIVEFFGMPAAGKTTVVEGLRARDSLDATYIMDREPRPTRPRRIREKIRHRGRDGSDELRDLAEAVAESPALLTTFEEGVLADDPSQASAHWRNLLSWSVAYRRLRGNDGLVVVDAGWCQRAVGEFIMTGDAGSHAASFAEVVPKPHAAVVAVVPVETALSRMWDRGFLPVRFRTEHRDAIAAAMGRYRITIERTCDVLAAHGVPVLQLPDAPLAERLAVSSAFLDDQLADSRRSPRIPR